MIDLYTYRTSNGRKVSIMLEETGLPYEVHVVDITRGDQDAPSFRAINPNGRIPAIIDREGPRDMPYPLFESGAILLYLAQKTGRYLPEDTAGRYRAIQWLMFQMGGIGPVFGQAFHYLHQASQDVPETALAYGRERFGRELRRLCGVMDGRLARAEFLAGAYSVADMSCFPWIALHRWFGLELAETPHLARWYQAVRARPAVRRGMDVPARDTMNSEREGPVE